MSFPHSDFEKYSLDESARKAVKSHGKEEYVLDQEARKMRENEHTGIELTGVELAYLKKVAFDRMGAIRDRISILEHPRYNEARNEKIDHEEVGALRGELDFLEHNLAEKLFGETKDAGAATLH